MGLISVLTVPADIIDRIRHKKKFRDKTAIPPIKGVAYSYSPMMEEKEETLKAYIPDFQKRDYSSFPSFYDAVKRPIFYNIYALTKSREEAEDLLQETFLRFLQSIDEVDQGKSILGYLMVMSRNLAFDHLKKKKAHLLEEEEWNSFGQEEPGFSQESVLLDRIKEVLNGKEFETFVLRAMDELSFQEITKLQKRPLGTVLWSYSHALKKIRKEIPHETL